MAKLTRLPPPPPPPSTKPEPCEICVRVLEGMLAKAKAGEIDGLAMAVSYPRSEEDPKGAFASILVPNASDDTLGFLGIVSVLQARLLASVDVPERDG